MKKVRGVSLEKELDQKLVNYSLQNGISVSALISLATSKYLMEAVTNGN